MTKVEVDAVHVIFFVEDQERSTAFYRLVLGAAPSLEVPGMTEFEIAAGLVLGLMPLRNVRRLLPDLAAEAASPAAPKAELYLVVPEPEHRLAVSIEAGGVELSPVRRRDWGARVGYCLDPDGHVLAFAAP